MTIGERTRGQKIKLALLALIGLGWFLASLGWSDGLFTVDELLYVAATDVWARDGAFAIWNGYAEYGADSLRLWLLQPGVDGLVSPYPSGYAMLATPLYEVFGSRAFMMLNAVAAALTIWLCYGTARTLFDDHDLGLNAGLILALATFVVDYALGIWPHALALFFETLAVFAVAKAWRRGAQASVGWHLLAGAAIGTALHFRVDAAIAGCSLLFIVILLIGPSPKNIGAFILGAAPGVFWAAQINLAKFGFFSPAYYGAGFGQNFLRIAVLLSIVGFAGLGLIFWAQGESGRRYLRKAALPVTVVILGLVLLIPASRTFLMDTLIGAYVLVVDMQSFSMLGARGVSITPEGVLKFYGGYKKALVQSMPFAAMILVLIPQFWKGDRRAGYWFLALYAAAWVAPFAPTQWHGGASNSMRYLLPLTPAIAILSACAWQRIAQGESIGTRGKGLVLGSIWLLLMAYALWIALVGYDLRRVWFNLAPLHIAALIAVLCIAFSCFKAARGTLGYALKAAVLIAFYFAFNSAYISDLHSNWFNRTLSNREYHEAVLPRAHSLLYTVSFNSALAQVVTADAIVALPDYRTGRIDMDLMAAALDDGYRVFAQGEHVLALVSGRLPDGLTLTPLANSEAPEVQEVVRED